MKRTITLEKLIDLLDKAKENKLTEETIKHLAGKIRTKLIDLEEYEDCVTINKMEQEQLSRFKEDREKMVTNLLNKNDMKKLLDLV